jgi:hypothetical protein
MYVNIGRRRMMSTTSSQHHDPLYAERAGRVNISRVRWTREVPDAIRSLGALANANYADVVTAPIDAGPVEPGWMIQAALKGVPRGLLVLVPLVQRAVLGLRLQLRPSPDNLLGWKIAERSERWIRIEAASWFLTGHVVMHADEGQMYFASFIRYDRRLAALVWPPVSLIHRQVALALVRSAIRALNDESAA